MPCKMLLPMCPAKPTIVLRRLQAGAPMIANEDLVWLAIPLIVVAVAVLVGVIVDMISEARRAARRRAERDERESPLQYL